MRKGGLITLGTLSLICALLSFAAAVYIAKNWRYDTWCNIWTIQVDEYYDNYNSGDDYYFYPSWKKCNYRLWTTLEMIGGILWLLAAFAPFYVVCSGKYENMRRPVAEAPVVVPTTTSAAAAAPHVLEMGTIPMTTLPPQGTAGFAKATYVSDNAGQV